MSGVSLAWEIADADAEAGTITLTIQAVGKTSCDLCLLQEGDAIKDVAGPLGEATELIDSGHAVCVGGGVGTAVVHPMAQGLAQNGVQVTSIIGGRAREWVIFEDELKRYGDVRVCTDDGSYGRHGFVTDELKAIIEEEKINIDTAVVIGPPLMMKFTCKVTEPHKIKTFASLNTIMVDGTGMCGACRVTVGGKTKFVCVDGPEFDGHQVDFDEMMMRQKQYLPEEKLAYDHCKTHGCHKA